MLRTTLLAAALCCGLAAAALAELAEGDVPKGFGGDARFLNCDDIDLVKLRSKVVVIQLTHTRSDPCKEQVGKLKELRDKLGEKGLRIVLAFEEPVDAVETFVKQHAVDFPVAAAISDLRTRFGLKGGFPTAYVLDVEGKVAWIGNFADRAEIEMLRLLEKVTDRPWLPSAYDEVGRHIDAERFGDARSGLVAALAAEKVSDDDRARLEKALAWLDGLADKALAEAETERKKDVYDGWKALLAMAQRFPGFPAGEKAQEAADALLADKDARREIEAWQLFEVQFEEAKKVELDDKKAAIKLLQKVITKYRGTAAADKAKYWIDKLKE